MEIVKAIGFRTRFGGGSGTPRNGLKGSKTHRNGLEKAPQCLETVWENGLEKAQKRAPKRTWENQMPPLSFILHATSACASRPIFRISWRRGGDSERA